MLFLDKCVATLGGCFLTLIFQVVPIIRQRKIIIDILKPMILLHFFHKNHGFNKKTFANYTKRTKKKKKKSVYQLF